MTKRLLSYPLLTVALLFAVLAAANVTFAERPDNCDPEDREVLGNTNSPCNWDFHTDEIAMVEYAVVENTVGDSCHEQLTFSPFNGTAEWENIDLVRIQLGAIDEQGEPTYPWGRWNLHLLEYRKSSIVATANNLQIHRIGGAFTPDSSIPQATDWPSTHTYNLSASDYSILQIEISDSFFLALNKESEWLPMPVNTADFNLLMNDCLAGIKQRLENQAKLEETRQKIEAERVAQERAAKQAAAEAERQRLETEAAREALRLARETELAKTQALIQQLEREKIIIGIWQEVVAEKQKGAEARAEITNRYLAEIEANAAEFKASVVAKAEEIRRLQEINAAIAGAIIAHNDEVERQLAAQAEREAEQRAKLEDLAVEVLELTPTATP